MRRFLSLLTTAVLAAPLAAQQNNPYAFLSESAKEPEQGSPQSTVPSLRLRPNQELPYYVYVRNPGSDLWEKLTVVLAADEKGDSVLAEGNLPEIKSGETKRVKLTAKASTPVTATEKSAGDKAANDKPVATPAPANAALPSAVYLLLFRPSETNPRSLVASANAKSLIAVRIMSPKEYLDISTATPIGITAGNNDLYVQIGDKNKSSPFRGKPSKVILNVRPDLIPSLDPTAPREGTYEALVGPGAEKITLVAKNLRFTGEDRKGVVSITADGFSNAFVYQVDFKGTSPKPVEENGFLHIDAPRFTVTGKPYAVRLEIFGDEAGGQPRLKFFRSEVGAPESVTADLTTPRDQKTGFRIGADGELIVASEVKDWQISLDTAGLYGLRRMTFELEKSNRAFAPAEAVAMFDDTGPAGVEFVKPPATAQKGKKFRVAARAEDRESGLKPGGVWFFIGDPPAEGKKPAKGTFAPGVLTPDGNFTVEFDTPDVKGAFEVTVRFTNNVGLTTEKILEIFALEIPTTGKIEGRVVQGPECAQPGLTVELRDGDGKKLTTVTTNEKGEFIFDNLKPGSYSVFCNKPIDYNSRGEEKVAITAGETARATISLKR